MRRRRTTFPYKGTRGKPFGTRFRSYHLSALREHENLNVYKKSVNKLTMFKKGYIIDIQFNAFYGGQVTFYTVF